jgi:DnaJ-class molecular chaperone
VSDVAPHRVSSAAPAATLHRHGAHRRARSGARHKVDVPTLGDPVRLRIPPGTSSGQQFRVPRVRRQPALSDGREPGDLVVDVQIALPPVTDERSRELLKEFGRLNDVNVRQHLFE